MEEEGLEKELPPHQKSVYGRVSGAFVASVVFPCLLFLFLFIFSPPAGIQLPQAEFDRPAERDITLVSTSSLSPVQPEVGRADDNLINPMPFDTPPLLTENETKSDVENIEQFIEPPNIVANDPEQDSEITEALNADQQEVMAVVNESITEYITVQKAELNREYVEGCIRHRNRFGLNSDCPENVLANIQLNSEETEIVDELFAELNRSSNDARISGKLERENKVLKGLLEGDNPALEQVQTRLALNNQYINFLNGNINPLVAQISSATGFSNDFGRTITARPYQFRCKESPCVYKFTGFTVKRPPNYVQKEATFPSQTPLFMGSPD